MSKKGVVEVTGLGDPLVFDFKGMTDSARLQAVKNLEALIATSLRKLRVTDHEAARYTAALNALKRAYQLFLEWRGDTYDDFPEWVNDMYVEGNLDNEASKEDDPFLPEKP